MLEKFFKASGPVALALALVLAVVWGANQITTEEPVARSYSCAVYTEQGCAKYVVASGGELEIQSGGTLDIQSGATSGFGGNLLVTGTLDVDGAATLNSSLDVDGNISSGTGAVTMTDSVNVTGAVDLDSTLNADGAVTFNSSLDVDGNISSGTGAVTVTDSVNVTGAVDLASTLQFGTDNLYPLGYASSGYQIVCGTSGTFTASTAVTVTGLSTVTYALVTQITDPADTAAIVSVDAPSTTTLTINSWVVTPTIGVGTTGVNVFYCAIGIQ